jgi:hypothetical protein
MDRPGPTDGPARSYTRPIIPAGRYVRRRVHTGQPRLCLFRCALHLRILCISLARSLALRKQAQPSTCAHCLSLSCTNRPAADGDEDLVRRDAAVADLHRVPVDKLRQPLHHLRNRVYVSLSLTNSLCLPLSLPTPPSLPSLSLSLSLSLSPSLSQSLSPSFCLFVFPSFPPPLLPHSSPLIHVSRSLARSLASLSHQQR